MLLHDIIAWATTLFGQAACRDLKLTLALPPPLVHALDSTTVSKNGKLLYDFPNRPYDHSLSCLPAPVCFMLSLDKTSMGFIKTLSFWFELTSSDLAQEPQSTLPIDLIKASAPGSASLHSALPFPCDPSRRAVYFLQDLWVINFSISITLVSYWTMVHYLALCVPFNKC